MKHNKYSNPGIIFETLSKSILGDLSNNNLKNASRKFYLLKKYFMDKKRELYKANAVFNKLLYSESKDSVLGFKFLEYLMKEYYEVVDQKILKNELSLICEGFDRISTKKDILDTKIDNYKLFASFKCLLDDPKNKLFSEEKMHCESVILEHLKLNKKKDLTGYHILDEEQLEEQKLAMIILMKEFQENYRYVLSEEQKNVLFKYLTSSSDKSFLRWIEKQKKSILNQLEDKQDKIVTEVLKEKLDLVKEKINLVGQNNIVSSEDLINIMLSFELKDNLKFI